MSQYAAPTTPEQFAERFLNPLDTFTADTTTVDDLARNHRPLFDDYMKAANLLGVTENETFEDVFGDLLIRVPDDPEIMERLRVNFVEGE